MRPKQLYPYFTDLQYVKGIGPAFAKRFEKLCGSRIIDLLFHKPTSVLDRTYMPPITQAESGRVATFEITPEQYIEPPRRSLPFKVLCRNDSGYVEVVFFNLKADAIKNYLPLGQKRIISGKVENFGHVRQMPHPDYMIAPEKAAAVLRLEPQYPLTLGISQNRINGLIQTTLEKLPEIPELRLKELLTKLHNPKAANDIYESADLAYYELLAGQLARAILNSQITHHEGARISTPPSLKLPFTLTDGQQKALDEILADMKSGKRMFRLVQGDVGCGKTAVSLLAADAAINSSFQAAFMMPTTLLAMQQYEWFRAVSPHRVALLTSNEKGKKREEILEKVKNGEIDILIGTNALVQDWVEFKNLGLVVIDEQHRFGVIQRLKLTAKNEKAHVLLMSATPIPRSLTLAYYGEMEISRITQKPANRKPIETFIMSSEKLPEIYQSMGRALETGEKIYWICPLVEETEKSDLTAAVQRFDEISRIYGKQVGLVHGRMKESEKDEVLQKFLRGEHKILVATTVIEVGINVTDATIMFIEHAERFGLSQLHQLRGRVGRGEKQSKCILLYSGKPTERLKIMKKYDDGFKIAEEDLKLRGGGDWLGTRQSGFAEFRFAQFPRDEVALEEARIEAKKAVSGAGLTEKHKLLLSLFEYDDSLEYISAG